MARTRNALKRQKVVTVQSALFNNPDVVFFLACLLDARDLCKVSLTCKTMGGKQAGYSGLSLVEEAARRQFECASNWERSYLPKHDDEGWIELYRHLLLLRSKLTFDQLVGAKIQYGAHRSTVQTSNTNWKAVSSSALCSNHVMRAGRHYAVVTVHAGDEAVIGVVRPVQINKTDFDDGELDSFSPGFQRFWEYLRGKRTERWSDSNVHCCTISTTGFSDWFDWESALPLSRIGGFQREAPIGLLLDLVEGKLSAYQNGQRLIVLKDGLSGEYCWYGTVFSDTTISIERGSVPGDRG